jgi:hypothetical protein
MLSSASRTEPSRAPLQRQAFWIVKVASSFTRAAAEAISTFASLAGRVKAAGASRQG